MLISDEVLEVSKDAIDDIAEVGAVVKLKIPSLDQSTGNDTDKDFYSKLYGQTQDAEPIISKEYEIHAYVTYNPTQKQLLGAGLDNECKVVVMFITYELIALGFVDANAEFHDVISKLEKQLLVEYNGKLFQVNEVGMTGTLNGFSIVCNLGCDLYA